MSSNTFTKRWIQKDYAVSALRQGLAGQSQNGDPTATASSLSYLRRFIIKASRTASFARNHSFENDLIICMQFIYKKVNHIPCAQWILKLSLHFYNSCFLYFPSSKRRWFCSAANIMEYKSYSRRYNNCLLRMLLENIKILMEIRRLLI